MGLLLLLAAAPVQTSGGVVTSAHPEASAAGARILEEGGNALDALIATAYALSVVEPFSAGIGGGGFLIYRDSATGNVSALDYREVAPAKAKRDMYLEDGKVVPGRSTDGALSVAVPGMVAGFAEAQTKLGKKQLKDVLKPAIELAANGFRVYPDFYEASEARLELLRSFPASAAAFLKNGESYAVGELLVQPELARTLRSLSRGGAEIFKKGWVAIAIAKEMQRLGGALGLEDLRAYSPRWREPLVGRYRGRELYFMPPPSSGGVAILQVLGMLEHDRKLRGRTDRPDDPDDLHVLLEAMRRAYADRATFLGDPATMRLPIEKITSADYLLERYKTIDLKRATPSSEVHAGNAPLPEPMHTTNITVIDAAGNVAVATQTVNLVFGSGIVVPGTGVLLNDEMDDFAAAPGVPNAFGLVGGDANSIAPGKVPLSSMTPTIVVEDGRVRLAVGAPGGSTIITTVLMTIVRTIDQGMGVQEALGRGRFRNQWLPDRLLMERDALPPHLVEELTRRGHVPSVVDYWGNGNAIEVLPDGTRVAVADWRGNGAAVAAREKAQKVK